MLTRTAKLLVAFSGSLLLLAPPGIFREGPSSLRTSVTLAVSMYALALTLWLGARHETLRKRTSLPQRTFDETVFLAFISTIPWALVELLTAAVPSVGSTV